MPGALSHMKISKLQELCKEKGIKDTGTRAVLIARLRGKEEKGGDGELLEMVKNLKDTLTVLNESLFALLPGEISQSHIEKLEVANASETLRKRARALTPSSATEMSEKAEKNEKGKKKKKKQKEEKEEDEDDEDGKVAKE